jgi:hypothetical protein
VEVFAGSGNSGNADGNGIFCSFGGPTAVACDAADNIYVADAASLSYGHLIRRITQNRDVETIAGHPTSWGSEDADGTGSNAPFASAFARIWAMTFDSKGNLLLACGASVRKISAQTNVLTVAGSFTESSYSNGSGASARFRSAQGVCVAGDKIFISDYYDHRVRSITGNPVPEPVPPGTLAMELYGGLSTGSKLPKMVRNGTRSIHYF